jgi:hypothetical protein
MSVEFGGFVESVENIIQAKVRRSMSCDFCGVGVGNS